MILRLKQIHKTNQMPHLYSYFTRFRSSPSEMFLRKGVLKTWSKFTGEQACRSAICKATLLKLHFGMGVLLQIYCIFSEHRFLKTPLRGCFWRFSKSIEHTLFCRLFDKLLVIKGTLMQIWKSPFKLAFI